MQLHKQLKSEERSDLTLGDDHGVIESFVDGSSKLYQTTAIGCNCNYIFNEGMVICKHIIFFRKSSALNIFDEVIYGQEYRDEFMNVNMSSPIVSDEAPERHFEQLEYYEVVDGTSKPGLPKPPSSRYLEAKEQTDVLAELIAAAPASMHLQYLQFLSYLNEQVRAAKVPVLNDQCSSPACVPTDDADDNAFTCCSPKSNVLIADDEISNDIISSNNSSSVLSTSSHSNVSLSLAFSIDDDQKKYIRNKEMIDTGTVDNFVILLLEKHPFQYQSCARSQPGACFQKIDNSIANFQIIHLHAKSHFVLTTQTKDGTINIYDSLPPNNLFLEHDSELFTKLSELYTSITNIYLYCPQKQEGFVDCGIFCMANLWELVAGKDPHQVHFSQSNFREILMKMMTDVKLYDFEVGSKGRGRKRKAEGVKMSVCQTIKSISNLQDDLVFPDGGSQKGRPKLNKQRRYNPNFNKKKLMKQVLWWWWWSVGIHNRTLSIPVWVYITTS